MKQPKLGELIREMRKSLFDKEITQGELAQNAGVTRSMIAHTESNNTIPGDDVLQKIAKFFAQDDIEYSILLRKMRRAVLYTKNPEVFVDVFSNIPIKNNDEQWLFNQITLPESLCIKLQDAMFKESIDSKILSEKTHLKAESIRAIIHGKRTVTMEGLRSLCEVLKCNFDEFQVMLGMIPETMKSTIARNRSLLHFLLSLNEACRDHKEEELTSLIDNLLRVVNKS